MIFILLKAKKISTLGAFFWRQTHYISKKKKTTTKRPSKEIRKRTEKNNSIKN